MDRSRPKKGTLQVLKIFRGSFKKLKFLAANAKLMPIAYVNSPFIAPIISHMCIIITLPKSGVACRCCPSNPEQRVNFIGQICRRRI
jgi:hypothetical protein